MAALARHGNFWYPVRLINRVIIEEEPYWHVKWWPLSTFANSIPTGAQWISLLSQDNIVDELWNRREERRLIRVCPSSLRRYHLLIYIYEAGTLASFLEAFCT
jgi:hypothetical protein